MANQNEKGLKRIINALFFSMKGFKAVWEHEEAFRQEFLIFLVGTPLAFWLVQSKVEQILMVGSLVLVLIVELLNSAVEAVVDRVGLENHELSGRAKDIGSASVFLSLAWAAATWIIILM